VDDNVPAALTTNGTEANPFRYILGQAENYVRTNMAALTWPDGNKVWNVVIVTNGAQITATSGTNGNHSVGVFGGANDNRLLVTGGGTKMTLHPLSGSTAFRTSGANRNSVRVEQGAELTVRGSVEVGRGSTSKSNQFVVDGATVTYGRSGNVGDPFSIGSRSAALGTGNISNVVVVCNGGVVKAFDPSSIATLVVGLRGFGR
jgi:hypothetical protein